MMHQAGIPQIHLRRPHLALVQVLVPGWQLAHDERVGQDVEIPTYRRIGHPEGTCKLRLYGRCERAFDIDLLTDDARLLEANAQWCPSGYHRSGKLALTAMKEGGKG